MGRINVSVTDEFRSAVKSYADERRITESAALVELAAIGLQQKTGQTPASIMRVHGGSPDRAVLSPPVPMAPASLPKTEATPTIPKTSIMLEMQEKKAEVPATAPSVTLDINKAAADLMRIWLFSLHEDGHGLAEYNVYTKAYKRDRPALNTLLKQGYIEIIEKRYEKVIYKLTEKGKNYKQP